MAERRDGNHEPLPTVIRRRARARHRTSPLDLPEAADHVGFTTRVPAPAATRAPVEQPPPRRRGRMRLVRPELEERSPPPPPLRQHRAPRHSEVRVIRPSVPPLAWRVDLSDSPSPLLILAADIVEATTLAMAEVGADALAIANISIIGPTLQRRASEPPVG